MCICVGKLVEVAVGPSESILDGTMQVPEVKGVGYLDSTPYGRFNIEEGYLELVDLLGSHNDLMDENGILESICHRLIGNAMLSLHHPPL